MRASMMKGLPPLVLLVLPLMLSARVSAWSDHATLAWPLLRALPELSEHLLTAEPLSEFVSQEQGALAEVLAEFEIWSGENIQNYPVTPKGLRFTAEGDAEPLYRFLAAIRVNPELPYTLYRQRTVDDSAHLIAPLGWSDLSFLSVGTSHVAVEYVRLQPGSQVYAAHVLAAASDEPDYGMDIGLFENNGTRFGKAYGFGEQPFGNPNLEYGSQAPFHMGFYHLDWLTRTAQPGLLRTLPLWRIALYDRLAEFAFKSGHPYWGWRFMGWALHYIGDLTQPYHTVPLPGVNTAQALWLVAQGRTDEAVQLVSNRHGVLESYQYQRVQAQQESGDWQAPMLLAIKGEPSDYRFAPRQVIDDLTADSAAAANDLDATLLTYMPPLFVADPDFEWTGSGYESEIVERVRAAGGDSAISALDEAVTEQLVRFSRYARGWIERGLEAEAR